MHDIEQVNTEITENSKLQSTTLIFDKGVLLVLSSVNFANTYVIDRLKHIIGRSIDSDFVINDTLVSKKHCEITFSEGKFYVEDLDSRNGTFVNGKRIKKKTALFYGDKLSIGDTILRLYLEEKIEKK